MNVKISSFNCRNFGRSAVLKDRHSYIAKLILEEKFGIIALQEIKGQIYVDCILSKLNLGSAGKWKGRADNDSAANDYAFIWNSERIILPKTRLLNGSVRTYFPHVYKQYERDPELGMIGFARPPFYGRFQTNSRGLPNIEIRLINTHIRYGKGRDGEEKAPNTSDIAFRRYELNALTRNIYYYVSDKVYGRREGYSNPMTAYTLLLGDYNMNLERSGAGSPSMGFLEKIEISRKGGKDDMVIVTGQSGLTTLKKTSVDDKNETDRQIFANNYDHFSYDENRFDRVSKRIERIDTVKRYCKNDPEKHNEEISDHIPIKMTLAIREDV